MIRHRRTAILLASALFAVTASVAPAPSSGQASLTANPPTTPNDHTFGALETVATFPGPMPTGVTVSRGNRIFVNFPRWGDDVPFTVVELVHGKAVAYPNVEINDWPGRNLPNPNAFGSLADDGYLYVTANQLNRQPTMHNGQDLRVKPYTLFRLKVNAKPVRLM